MVWSEISSLSLVILVLGKARSYRAPNLSYRGPESPLWFHVSRKHSAQDMLREQAHCHDEAAYHQLSIAVTFWIIWIFSTEECSNLMQNLMQIHCSTRSVILNVMATQNSCSLNIIYHPHWLVQWSHHCSHMRIPVHSPWLPDYDVVQTVLIILTMAGLFLGSPHVTMKQYIYFYLKKIFPNPILNITRSKMKFEGGLTPIFIKT